MTDTCGAPHPLRLEAFGMICGASIPRKNCPVERPDCPYLTAAQRTRLWPLPDPRQRLEIHR